MANVHLKCTCFKRNSISLFVILQSFPSAPPLTLGLGPHPIRQPFRCSAFQTYLRLTAPLIISAGAEPCQLVSPLPRCCVSLCPTPAVYSLPGSQYDLLKCKPIPVTSLLKTLQRFPNLLTRSFKVYYDPHSLKT